MPTCILLAPAKINFHLEILGLRSDGFHELAMVMQTVAVADRVTLKLRADRQITITCNRPAVPLDRTNLAHRAVELMAQRFPQAATGVDIDLEKHIPMAAGLAGGSGNGAAVLVGLNQLWQTGATVTELQDLAAQLGSDLPFSISGGTALATGRGEILDPLPTLHQGAVVLGKYRSLEVSTPWAYRTYREQFGSSYPERSNAQQTHAPELIQAIQHRAPAAIGRALYNDLEKVVLPTHRQVAALKAAFSSTNPLGVLMSGSGPTVFAWVENIAQAEEIKAQVGQLLPDPDLELLAAPLCDRGVQIIA